LLLFQSATVQEVLMQPVALITGGSQGLGLALARSLVRLGFAVVIDARRTDRLAAAARTLIDEGGTVAAIAGDVTDAGHRRELIATATQLGRLRALVNNASTLGASPLPELTAVPLDVVTTTFHVNVVAPLALLQEAAPHLSDGATVVNITSDAGAEPYPTWGVYGASKAALEHLGRVLAVERPDLRVLAVDPGDLRTEMHQAAFPGEDIGDRPLPESIAPAIAELITGTAPSGRYTPTELVAP
jgi:NAD(P)-dependent dehydrogenase (short-subunit alcohol dehydrogenase family)